MKKVLIVPSNTDLNRGDQSLTWASITIAKEVFGDNVSIFLYRTKGKLADKRKTNHQTELLEYPFLTRILSHPRRDGTENKVKFSKLMVLKWGGIAVFDLFVTMCLISKIKFLNSIAIKFLNEEQKQSYESFKGLDALFVKGGGFLHSYGSIVDPYVMYFQLFDVFLAKRFNIPVFILPNSIGPLKNDLAKKIVFKALHYAKVVYVRESKSLEFLIKNGIEATKSPDLGFYLQPSQRDFKEYLLDKGIELETKKCIAITLRPYRFDGYANADQLYNNYISEIEKLILNLLNGNINVTLVAHTLGPSAHEDDTIPLLQIYERLKGTESLIYLDDKELNSEDLEKIYSYFDVVIGTRFHSVIFALNVNTPAIAIAYGGNKAVGIMKDMELQQFVVPIENPKADLLFELSSRIFEERSEYILKIEIYKEQIKKEKEILVNNIKKYF